mmetsp:Transcript_934/g.3017  ORF Transcript_934/g.3017 Transcript_934/m.3017 type:complete len:333 (-) Transcript_934:1080-2078(-)
MRSGTSKLYVAALLTAFTCSQGLLMEGSKVDGRYPYNSSVVPLLAEVVKFAFSCCLLYRQRRRDPNGTLMTTDLGNVLLYPVPSVIYVVHNNVQFYTMSYVDAATYQILGNLKIVTTGIFFRLFLGRALTRTQWVALVLLTLGATTSQIEGCGLLLSAPTVGYLLGAASACLSAAAGIYTEFLLKKNNDNLYWQNCQLYGFGIVFNAVNLSLIDIRNNFAHGWWLSNGLDGFSFVVWLIVFNFSFSGLFVSWLQKYADTIVKVYSTSSAMLLTALLAVMLFNLTASLQLFVGISIACCSLILYFMPIEYTHVTNTIPVTNMLPSTRRQSKNY